jgi:hypothetical protein
MPEIIENHSDLGLTYDLAFVHTDLLHIPEYDPIHALNKNNTPLDVANMIDDAMFRAQTSYFDGPTCEELADDVRVNMCNPLSESELSKNNDFWIRVTNYLYDFRDEERRCGEEWAEEIYYASLDREHDLMNEYREERNRSRDDYYN